jgi:cytochrome c oxidase subunit 2
MKRTWWAKSGFCAAALLGICAFGARPQNENAPQDESAARRIEISAKRFEFDPNEITVKKGEPVVLVLHSSDVTHGLEIKELGIKVDLPNGKDVEVPLTATQTGDLEGKCSHFCGLHHGDMSLTVHVVDQ